MKRKSKPELKIYSFFSETAQTVGLKTEDVEEVYLWAIREMKKQIMEKPTLSININSFGKFITDRRTIAREAFQKLFLINKFLNRYPPGTMPLNTPEKHAVLLLRAFEMIGELKKHPKKYKNDTKSDKGLRILLGNARKNLESFDCTDYPNLNKIKTDEQLF